MQLRDVAAALRKQDDVNGVLAALKLVDRLIEAAPDELGQYAGATRFPGHDHSAETLPSVKQYHRLKPACACASRQADTPHLRVIAATGK